MPPTHQFEHLPLLIRFRGPANIRGGGTEPDSVRNNKANRGAHSGALAGQGNNASGAWKTQRATRETEARPTLPNRMPLLLQIDPNLDPAFLTFLREKLSFEIVAEQADGYIIVATEDVDLAAFQRLVSEFGTDTWGSGSVARIFQLSGPEDQDARLRRILSDALYREWPNLEDQRTYTVDVGVECQGNVDIPKPFERGERETDPHWAHRQSEWNQLRDAAYQAWDDLYNEREGELRAFLRHPSYGAQLLNSFSDDPDTRFPDHFTARIEIKGIGLRDLVLNYAYIFEVTEPDEVDTQRPLEVADAATPLPTLNAPQEGAPAVCVIDSGIQEGHRLLEPAVDRDQSRCFLPGRPADAVADEVRPRGHGTRVAGAVLYGEAPPDAGVVELLYWIQNARVLDQECRLPENLFPPDYLRAVIKHFHEGKRKTRIFNHSINANTPCRTTHMSAWAAEMDLLSYHHDVLFIVSAGNLSSDRNDQFFPGVRQLLGDNKEYPAYLHEPCCRVANPGQSLQALTVGSIAYDRFNQDDWRSIATDRDHASSFSRCGFGIWDAIKPEVVEYGGDTLVNAGGGLTLVGTPPLGAACYPDLVASTLHGLTQAHCRDEVGTSFATPKVSRIAAALQAVLPKESSLLYRALIVQSARWPAWACDLSKPEKLNVLRRIGYGIPDLERATTNDDYRVTIVSDEQTITPNECHIFQVPIPESMRGQADEYEIRIDVTLSYVAQPKRTRRNTNRYLSTWLDWKASKLGQSLDDFRTKALKDQDEVEGVARGSSLPWTLGAQANHGIDGARRNAGTVQKDWAVVKSYKLPDHFCIAVIAHKGWSNDPEATARYSLAVSFEVVNQAIKIYDDLMAAINELRQELEQEVEVEAEAVEAQV